MPVLPPLNASVATDSIQVSERIPKTIKLGAKAGQDMQFKVLIPKSISISNLLIWLLDFYSGREFSLCDSKDIYIFKYSLFCAGVRNRIWI